MTEHSYVPAAGHDWFLPFYDPIMWLLGFDKARQALVDQAALQPHDRVLDVGCGTGAVSVLVKQAHPGVDVVGLDPDDNALGRARRRAARAGVSIRFDLGFAGTLAYPDRSFTRVLSSMMFHHLGSEEKRKMLGEVRRVLAPGGRLEMLDIGGRAPGAGRSPARLVHSRERLADSAEVRVLALMAGAELVDARVTDRRPFLLGTLAYYQAAAPADRS